MNDFTCCINIPSHAGRFDDVGGQDVRVLPRPREVHWYFVSWYLGNLLCPSPFSWVSVRSNLPIAVPSVSPSSSSFFPLSFSSSSCSCTPSSYPFFLCSSGSSSNPCSFPPSLVDSPHRRLRTRRPVLLRLLPPPLSGEPRRHAPRELPETPSVFVAYSLSSLFLSSFSGLLPVGEFGEERRRLTGEGAGRISRRRNRVLHQLEVSYVAGGLRHEHHAHSEHGARHSVELVPAGGAEGV